MYRVHQPRILCRFNYFLSRLKPIPLPIDKTPREYLAPSVGKNKHPIVWQLQKIAQDN